jgi:stearoyl-CoA desaturase (Delta-9 desaturase)
MTETAAAAIDAAAGDAAARTEKLIAIGMVVVPTAFTLLAFGLALAYGVSTTAILLFAVFYLITSAGVEIGLHRYFSHRAFKCGKAVRLGLGIAGSMAGQGPVLFWATTHRRHHRHSDTEDDPHSPIGHGVSGIWRAHLGWLFEEHRFEPGREVPDLVRDHATMLANRHYLLWYGFGLLLPALIAFAATGTAYGALEGLLWGGLLRVFVVHHLIWSVNSLCHLVGRQPWKSRDESRNLAILALPSLGGAWHNHHHAFPASATTSLAWWQLDPSGWIIRGAEALGLVWDVRRPPPRQHLESRSR